MSGANSWHEDNTRTLAAAIAAVRQLLEQRAASVRVSLPPSNAAEQRKEGLLRRLTRNKENQFPPTPAVFLLSDETNDAPKAAPAKPPEAPSQADAKAAPPALVALRQKLGLTQFEQDILVLCAAMELDTSVAALCAQAQGDASRAYPTFALAL